MCSVPRWTRTAAVAMVLLACSATVAANEEGSTANSTWQAPCPRAVFRVLEENVPGTSGTFRQHKWLDWWEFEAYLKDPPFDIRKHPVVTAEVSAVPCARLGCCSSFFSFRPNTTDLSVFWQVYGEGFFKPIYDKLRDLKPQYILDAGANVGYSTILFGMLFPGVTIISVEPDSDNYRALVFNTHRFPNVYPVNAGIWGRETYITLRRGKSEESGQWGHTFMETDKPAGEDSLYGVTISSLMDRFQFPRLDFAKVDIEGAEGIAFDKRADLRWLNSTRLVAVEAHDYKAQFYGLNTVLDVVWNTFLAREEQFSWFWEGEHTYFERKGDAPLQPWPLEGAEGRGVQSGAGADAMTEIKIPFSQNKRNWRHRLARSQRGN